MNNVPDENETIAAKRAARLGKRLLSKRPTNRRFWWSVYHVEVIILLFLFAVNMYVVAPIWGSAAPIIPYSGPGMPLLAKTIQLTGSSLEQSYQYVHIVFFLLFPLSLYYFVRIVTERKLPAFFAVLIASLPVYPFAEVRAHAAFFGGDGPHIVSLALIPLVLAALLQFLQKGTFTYFAFAAGTTAVILLISAFGFLNLVIFSFLVCFSEMLLGNGRLKLMRLGTIVVFSIALTSFWYNPGLVYWMIASPFGEEIRIMIHRLIPVSLFTIPVLATLGYLLFDRKPNLQSVFLASFFTIGFAIIALSGGGIFPGNPSRYVAELGLSLAFLLSIVIVKFADYLKFLKNPRFISVTKPAFINGILIILFLVSLYGIVAGRSSIHTTKDNVLGIWTGIDRGEIWEKRDTFGVVSRSIGYFITGVSIGGIALLRLRMKSLDEKAS